MRDRKLAVRYARALLSAFPDPAQAQSTDQFLIALRTLMKQPGEFRDLMLDPSFSRASRKELLRTLAADRGLPSTLVNFLSTLVDNNRVAALPSIAELFHEEREAALGIVPAEFVTAVPVDEQMLERARAAIQKMTGRKIRLTSRVDQGLIGGAVTRIGSTVYDGSLRTQLSRLRSKMIQE